MNDSQDDSVFSRKGFFGQFFSLVKKGVANQVDRKLAKMLEAPLRPPGALDEIEFLSACTRCGDCVDACPYHAIQRMPAQAGLAANTPFIEPNIQACRVCVDFPCVAACGEEALLPVEPRSVKMGRAVVDVAECQTYDDRVCTLCYDACPFPEHALTIDEAFHPLVLDGCIGCGLCERHCPVTPVGIRSLSPIRLHALQLEENYVFGIFRNDEEKESE